MIAEKLDRDLDNIIKEMSITKNEELLTNLDYNLRLIRNKKKFLRIFDELNTLGHIRKDETHLYGLIFENFKKMNKDQVNELCREIKSVDAGIMFGGYYDYNRLALFVPKDLVYNDLDIKNILKL